MLPSCSPQHPPATWELNKLIYYCLISQFRWVMMLCQAPWLISDLRNKKGACWLLVPSRWGHQGAWAPGRRSAVTWSLRNWKPISLPAERWCFFVSITWARCPFSDEVFKCRFSWVPLFVLFFLIVLPCACALLEELNPPVLECLPLDISPLPSHCFPEMINPP